MQWYVNISENVGVQELRRRRDMQLDMQRVTAWAAKTREIDALSKHVGSDCFLLPSDVVVHPFHHSLSTASLRARFLLLQAYVHTTKKQTQTQTNNTKR
jgi:hypothetical protein